MSALARASRAAFSALARAPAARAPAMRAAAPASSRGLASYPSDRKYKSSHEWVKVEGDVATVGITDHAQAALGEIVFADLPDAGSEFAAGENAAAVESVKAAGEIYAPVGGEVVAVNESLEDTPDMINKEPHGDGWMFKLKLADAGEVDALMDADAYEATLDDK